MSNIENLIEELLEAVKEGIETDKPKDKKSKGCSSLCEDFKKSDKQAEEISRKVADVITDWEDDEDVSSVSSLHARSKIAIMLLTVNCLDMPSEVLDLYLSHILKIIRKNIKEIEKD